MDLAVGHGTANEIGATGGPPQPKRFDDDDNDDDDVRLSQCARKRCTTGYI